MSANVQEKIDQLVKSDKVVLFMKGSRSAPQCGFSATVVGVLDKYLPDYTTVNVLADPEIRDGVKEYASWPTIPQLYVDGEFVGGCDIIREMDDQGELVGTLGDAVELPDPPEIEVTDAAAKVFKQALEEAESGEKLRIVIDSSFRHDLALSASKANDLEVETNGVTLLIDAGSARRAGGLKIDWVEKPQTGFKMDNPNAPPSVKPVSAVEAKAMVEDGAKLLDVRTAQELKIASVDQAVHLSSDRMDEITALPKDTPLVFMCHHGQRSFQAAMHFLELGFRNVHNLSGGIDAWSRTVDPNVPKY